MPKTVKRTEHLWLFGKREDFVLYDSGVALDTRQYQHTGTTPATHQKNQIVLHFTAGNGPASGSISWWNMIAPLDSATPWLCPKYFDSHAPHTYAVAAEGDCPDGHGHLQFQNNRASAHYVVEQGANRMSTAQRYTDVVEVVASDNITWHGEVVNNCSIGIEHSNVGTTWSAARNDTFTGTGGAKRPTDQNHWLHLASPSFPNSNLSSHDFQAYDEQQYLGIIMLLRYLCIKHRISRRFLGDTTAEKMERLWPHRDAAALSKLMRFRGILSHMNCHKDKECGGPAMHRNRLFRGIIDEWWMPVEVDGGQRPYYMGPFDPQASTPSYFRWSGAALQAHLFHDADLDALQNTRSFYDLDRTEYYYAKSEDPAVAGTFPIGTNKIWHGGVHFAGPTNNPRVFAATSGTIVAARLGSNATTEADPELGSQRFVLIRHCVYWRQQADPGGGERTDYTVDPTYFFTLYMHLAPFANLTAVDNQNPPWFNYWLRHRAAAADPNVVFNPDAPVSVGDWLGQCGTYRSKQMIHFEVMSHDELTVAPWNDAQFRIVDNDANVICDSAALNNFVSGANVTRLDALRAAPQLRKVKSFHKSEWALADASALTPVLPDAAARNNYWNRIRPFMWVADAVAANSDLSTQLCDASGMMWHYHPVTFMDFVNQLVLRENGRVSEPDYRDTNVTMQDEFLRQYVNYSSGTGVPAAADNQTLRPFSISSGGSEYHFNRRDLACHLPAPHDPADDPPKGTKFHISLLDVLENIRVSFGSPINVNLSYVCSAHNVAANQPQCVLGTAAALTAHASGLAIDIRPASATQTSCRSLWTAARNAADVFRASCGDHSGEPSHAELQGHVQSVNVSTTPTVEGKLSTGAALTPAEVSAFVIHLELSESVKTVSWVCWLRTTTRATSVNVQLLTVVGTFTDQLSAAAESLPGQQVTQGTAGFEAAIVRPTRALRVALRAPGIVGFFSTAAEAESEAVSGNAWPEES
jgi:hypothetical protein